MIEYTVRSQFPDQTHVEPYLAWLTGGHIGDLIEGGALSGYAVLETDPDDQIVVLSRFIFPDRGAYDRYLEETAPRLREEGVDKFGPHTGIETSRTLGIVFPPN